MMHRTQTFILFSLLLLTACGSHHDAAPGPPPEAAVLVSPAQNSICVTGTASSATESNIVFQWKKAANADSYTVTVKNLQSGVSLSQSASQVQATISLPRNTPFSWTVTSQSMHNTTTTPSENWKFYNSGEGVTSYAPFPADQLSPGSGDYMDAGSVALSWTGSDPDSDIVSYDVYLGTKSSPPLLQKGLVTNTTTAQVVKNTKYYWKVVTHDSQGNTSESAIIQFNVD